MLIQMTWEKVDLRTARPLDTLEGGWPVVLLESASDYLQCRNPIYDSITIMANYYGKVLWQSCVDLHTY